VVFIGEKSMGEISDAHLLIIIVPENLPGRFSLNRHLYLLKKYPTDQISVRTKFLMNLNDHGARNDGIGFQQQKDESTKVIRKIIASP
jgi:hypothetical protein